MIQISSVAATKIRSMAKDKEMPKFYFRVGLQAGGCMGLQQVFALVDAPSNGDIVFSIDGIDIIADPKSNKLLSGSTLDYVDTLVSKGFAWKLASNGAHCSCGTSFSL